jgi:HEAT repeat protein
MREAPAMAQPSSPDEMGMAATETDVQSLLESSDPLDREAAAYELPPTGRTLSRLIALAAGDPDPRVRRAAVSQLGDGTGPQTQAGLVDALGDPDPGVVEEAIVALMAAGDADAIPQLFELLNHPDPEIRELAGDAVEDLEDSTEL